jgi:hypothetical protein
VQRAGENRGPRDARNYSRVGWPILTDTAEGTVGGTTKMARGLAAVDVVGSRQARREAVVSAPWKCGAMGRRSPTAKYRLYASAGSGVRPLSPFTIVYTTIQAFGLCQPMALSLLSQHSDRQECSGAAYNEVVIRNCACILAWFILCG